MSAAGSARLIVSGEDPSHDIFIDRLGKGLGNLLGNFRAPKARIAAVQFQHEFNELTGRYFRPGFPVFREEKSRRYFHFISV